MKIKPCPINTLTETTCSLNVVILDKYYHLPNFGKFAKGQRSSVAKMNFQKMKTLDTTQSEQIMCDITMGNSIVTFKNSVPIW